MFVDADPGSGWRDGSMEDSVAGFRGIEELGLRGKVCGKMERWFFVSKIRRAAFGLPGESK